MKFLKKLNPFKRTPVGEPQTLKDFVQAEREEAEYPQPKSFSNEDEWYTACTDFVEFVLFNCNEIGASVEDHEVVCMDLGSEVQAALCIRHLQNLQAMLHNQERHSDTEIIFPDVDLDDDEEYDE